MGRFQQACNSEKVEKRRCSVGRVVPSFRENWTRQMSSSSSDLLEESIIGSLESSHMTIAPPRHSSRADQRISLPVLLRQEAPFRRTTSSRVSSLCLPRFSNTVIISKEDMESRLEEFRVRMSDRHSSCSSFFVSLEDLVAEEQRENDS
jgi:hypothetical protein